MNPSRQTQPEAENIEKSVILRQLNEYATLVAECSRYAMLERNAEENRHTVRPHIYARVKNEYTDRRGALDQEQEKQSETLRARLDTILEKRKALNERCRQEADRLEELDFRVRVGEFEEEQVKENRGELKQQLVRITRALADAQEVVRRFEQVGLLVKVPDLEHKDFLVLEEDPSSVSDDTPVVNYPTAMRSSSSETEETAGPPGGEDKACPIDSISGYLVALDGSRRGERFPLINAEITVGSSPEIDIRLADSGIARLHARIVYRKGRHYLETVDESGRCLVNGVETERAELKDGDVLCLGQTKMQVEYPREANA